MRMVMLRYLLMLCAAVHVGFAKDPCAEKHCDHDLICVVRDGLPVCLPNAKHCLVWGGSHCRTLDDRTFDLHGTCNYTFARAPCYGSNSSSLIDVQIARATATNATASFDRVLISVQSFSIILFKGPLQEVWVNGLKCRLPCYPSSTVRLFPSGSSVLLDTGLGLVLCYDWLFHVSVHLSQALASTACGLCSGSSRGSSPDNPALGGIDTVADRVEEVEFARSWKKGGDSSRCTDDCGSSCPLCVSTELKTSVLACSILQDPKGPFANCFKTVDPAPYVRACQTDLCTQKGDHELLCEALEAYVITCHVSGISVSSWRKLANCSLTCSANSHYATCVSMCPATCGDPDAPSRCLMGCAENCKCDEGFLLSGGECVPPSRCGCSHQGAYWLPNETFWAAKCQQRCTCDPTSRKVDCVPAQCEHDEKCALRDGAYSCHKGKRGLCVAQGDPHYTTFDGRKFDFDGNCMYLLAAHCPSTGSLLDFNIQVQNERRGDEGESFSKMIKVRLHGYEIKVSWELEDKILVNGLLLGLPTVLSRGKVKIYKTGLSLYVESDFGLTLTYNWNKRVTVALPRSYSGALCGICGNFNGDKNDDRVPPTVPDASSMPPWKTSEVVGCTDVVARKRPLCPEKSRLRLSKLDSCGILTAPKGPFQDCHEMVDPLSSFEDCVSDVCRNNFSQVVLCQILAGYVAACQDEGAEVHSWRSSKFCHLPCPANSKYALCSSPLPNVCAEPPSPHGAMCQEGCECVPGFSRSGEKCVPDSECGCLHDGVYHQSGEMFFSDDLCLNECTCKGRGLVECRSATCPAGTQCVVREGTRGCFLAPGSGRCSLTGELHFHTFDGLSFRFGGSCGYVLAETCNVSGAKDPSNAFSILFQRGQLHLHVYGTKITLASGQSGKVKVNGILWNLPAQLGQLRVLQHGLRTEVQTDTGLVLAYDLPSFVQVTVPRVYAGRLCGLCGDFDGKLINDLRLRGGGLTPDLEAFVASWKVLDVDCTDRTAVPTAVCSAKEAAQFRSEHCGRLSDPTGPFSECLPLVDPQPYLEDCVYDLCIFKEDRKKYCSHLQAYTLACHSAGAQIQTWRNQTFCPLICPANSKYSICVDACAVSCTNISHLACQLSRAEGCQCDPGFQRSVNRCVRPEKCGCFKDGRYYELDEVSWAQGCKKRCHCSTLRTFQCETAACPEGWECGLHNGATDCVKGAGSSLCGPGAPCASNSTYTLPSCWVLGGSHFKTFDGTVFDFQGNCTYTLAQKCGKGGLAPPFSIQIEKSQDRFSALKSVLVNVSEDHIVIKQGSTFIWVNDRQKLLPVRLPQVFIHQSGLFIVMNTTFGLSMMYNRAQYVQVGLPKNFPDVCGLCGDNNADGANDLRTPEGTVVDETAFGWSWRVADGDASCAADCADCSATEGELQLDVAEHDVTMHVFLWTESSPFQQCHVVVDPSAYSKLCALHRCVKQWDMAFLCQSLQSYTLACQAARVQIKGWRNSTFCSAHCPKNSHYELCGSACPAICGLPPSSSACSLPCLESCQCDEGFAHEGYLCVPTDSCGCIHQGSYHPRDQPFWADETCSERCVCKRPGEPASCGPSSCGPLAFCGLRDGERTCLPYQLVSCSLESGRHFRTFDGRTLDFQGSCAFRLAGVCASEAHLTPFEVQVQNAGDTNSALKVVVKVYGVTVEISSQNDGQVKVDSLRRNMPYTVSRGKVTVHVVGLRTLLLADFGLSVALYANDRLSVTLSNKYAGATCGLCGNYNGDPDDDVTGRAGRKALSPSELVRSWNTGGLPWCVEGCKGDCPTCTPKQREEYSGPTACGRLLDTKGPFRICHGKVKPRRFHDDCLSDLCSHGGIRSSLCRSLGNYVAACQEENMKIHGWRTPDFCDQPCLKGTVYELCPIIHNHTCEGSPTTNAALSPPGVCYENCVCRPGLLLSGALCVQPGNCGCVHQGQYLQAGKVFLTCKERCVCKAGGEVTCRPVFCTEDEDCRVHNGLLGCYPRIRVGRCSLAGRSHYSTFDGWGFHFPGTCNYTLSQSCAPLNASSSVVPFKVLLLNSESDKRRIGVEVYGLVLTLSPKHPNQVLVGGVLEPLPFSAGNLSVYRQGLYLAVRALNSVELTFDLRNHVVVGLPEVYNKGTCGLCGNYNGDPADDLWKPDSTVKPDVASKAPAAEGSGCSDECGDNCPLCVSLLPAYASDRQCGLMTAPAGAFSACHPLVDPASYYSNCMYDLCVSEGQSKLLCDGLQAYTEACREAGVQVLPWRNGTKCMFQCPKFSHYAPCVNACSAMCAEVRSVVECPAGCAEGCQCDTGFYYDGNGCVPREECGCFLEGRRYKPGEERLLKNCTLSCTCGPPVICKPHVCPDSHVCTVRDGVLTCHDSDPCKGTCRAHEKCAHKAGGPICDSPVLDLCWAWGGPHFRSFSGFDFDFDGTCTYMLAASSGGRDGLTAFTVTQKNERHRGSMSSSIRVIRVSVYGYMVTMHRLEKGAVRVNGLISLLPLSLMDKIRVDFWGELALLHTDFGLQVIYDWASLAIVALHPMYRNEVYGLCAYDHNHAAKSHGATASEWAKMHMVSDGDWLCCSDCRLPAASVTAEEEARSREQCTVLEDPTGPFALCNKQVVVGPFLQGCVNALSSSAGAKEVLAQALKSYYTVCQYHGFIFEVLRDLFLDEPDACGPHGKSSDCILPCRPSCDRFTSLACAKPCTPGCVCDKGYVYIERTCLPVADCGCFDSIGQHRQLNETFWSPGNCEDRCTCDPSSRTITCSRVPCAAGQRCQVFSGKRGCYPTNMVNCTLIGGLHFLTFNGYTFNFRDGHTYTLVKAPLNANGFVPFEVSIGNASGSSRLFHSLDLRVQVYEKDLVIAKDTPHRLTVHGLYRPLPYSFSSGQIVAYHSPSSITIQTDFGLQVALYRTGMITVVVPGWYSTVLRGMCGKPTDPKGELVMPSGNAKNLQEFADSYKTASAGGLSPPSVNRKPCGEEEQDFNDSHYCKVLRDEQGPFKECNGVLDPQLYFNGCLADTCAYAGHATALCNSIGHYVMACQAANLTVRQWRSDIFCGADCPVNSHYELCGPSCPDTCCNTVRSVPCTSLCQEGCQCDGGFLLSDDKCVPGPECGCQYKGQYYPRGTVVLGDSCQEKCHCGAGSKMVCSSASCGPQETCAVKEGIAKCVPAESGMCQVLGGFGYITFDDYALAHCGVCTYVLVQSSASILPHFKVLVSVERVENGHDDPLKAVVLILDKDEVEIFPRVLWKVRFNHEDFSLPMDVKNGAIKAYQDGGSSVLETDFGLQIRFATTLYVQVTLPAGYSGAISGLCGNYNGDAADDLKLHPKKATVSHTAFLKSSAEVVPGQHCALDCAENFDTCTVVSKTTANDSNPCDLLASTSGPFRRCRDTVAVGPYRDACVKARCATSRKQEALCLALEAYAAACHTKGIKVDAWREKSCRLECPDQSHASTCADSCSNTCPEMLTPGLCQRCSEGCQCNGSFVYNGNACVPFDQCGCVHHGRYITNEYYVEGCTKRCWCEQLGGAACEPTTCSSGQQCLLRDGAWGCHSDVGICQVLPNLTLKTLDGLELRLRRDVAFNLASLCDRESDRWFQLVIFQGRCEEDRAVNVLHLFLSGATVVIHNGGVYVNGDLVSLPISLSSGVSVSRVWAWPEGRITVRKGSGTEKQPDLELDVSTSGCVKVRPSSADSNKLCGACGNYNGLASDDLAEDTAWTMSVNSCGFGD
ncbi:hypothetical protein SKAU_G00418270 [Synaphobranchus kaupii]|uniref:VWFD domain-containing protein n=1 Tax=Synaphobranchus kaupii TaxID=118154 RepID=A0A9Q1E643_SYNKA|nr:hypothetical protein SKAU_G00418270 [Synaphobranchus kaupii]